MDCDIYCSRFRKPPIRVSTVQYSHCLSMTMASCIGPICRTVHHRPAVPCLCASRTEELHQHAHQPLRVHVLGAIHHVDTGVPRAPNGLLGHVTKVRGSCTNQTRPDHRTWRPRHLTVSRPPYPVPLQRTPPTFPTVMCARLSTVQGLAGA